MWLLVPIILISIVSFFFGKFTGIERIVEIEVEKEVPKVIVLDQTTTTEPFNEKNELNLIRQTEDCQVQLVQCITAVEKYNRISNDFITTEKFLNEKIESCVYEREVYKKSYENLSESL